MFAPLLLLFTFSKKEAELSKLSGLTSNWGHIFSKNWICFYKKNPINKLFNWNSMDEYTDFQLGALFVLILYITYKVNIYIKILLLE